MFTEVFDGLAAAASILTGFLIGMLLAPVEEIYAGTGERLRATDRNPADVGPLEDELPDLLAAHTNVVEWPPERVAADELAFLGSMSYLTTSSRTRCASPRSSRRSTSLRWVPLEAD